MSEAHKVNVSDVEEDFDKSLGEIARDMFLRDIERAQEIMFHEASIQDWAQSLRFVVPAAKANGRDFQFELIEGDDEQFKEPYVAVSYCWGDNVSRTDTPMKILVPYGCEHGEKTARDVARPDILERSMAFATSKGIRKVWIDQECINQEDPNDKEMAIQSMHLVYRYARITLVVLGHHVTTSCEIQALGNINTPSTNAPKSFAPFLNDLRPRIIKDKWFSRAWTAQEFAVSSSKNISFLVGWKEDLDVSGEDWMKLGTKNRRQTLPRAWELTWDDIWAVAATSCVPGAMDSMSGAMLAGTGDGCFTLVEHITSMNWKEADGISGLHSEGSSDDIKNVCIRYRKLSMIMTNAFGVLLDKACSKASDKLAILGNLTNYPYRIDTRLVISKQLNLSGCVIALALYNGDLSPLFGSDFLSGKPSEAERSSCLLPSWLPYLTGPLNHVLRVSSAHDRCRSPMLNGSRSLVVNGKLVVEGLLWKIVPFDGFNELKDYVLEQRQVFSGGAATKENTETIPMTFYQSLVMQLLTLGRHDILELILTVGLRRQFDSPEEIFRLIGELEEWYNGGQWPDITEQSMLEEREPPRDLGLTVGGNPRESQKVYFYKGAALIRMKVPGEEGPWSGEDNEILLWIYQAICEGTPLAIGECNTGKETLVSIFTVDPQEQQMAFTPLCQLEYEFGQNPWLHLHPKTSIWYVRSCDDKPTDTDIKIAKKRLQMQEDGSTNDRLNITDKILKVVNPDEEHCQRAVWSPGLSRLGMLKRETDGGTWRMAPLGKSASYYWFH